MRATAAETGRPGDEPGDLWRRSLDGYLHRMRSRRRLEQEAARHLALLWLLGKLPPDVKTIAAFRRDHGAAMKQVCRELTRLGQALDLCGGALIAIDGSTCQAVNGQQRNCSGRKLGPWIVEIDAKIAAYLQPLDSQDVEVPPLRTPTAAQMQQKLEPWHERQPRGRRDQQPQQQRGAHQIALTDPDRRKSTRRDSSLVGYHGPVAVAEQDRLIVAHEVTQAVTDQHHLVAMAARAKQTLGLDGLGVLFESELPVATHFGGIAIGPGPFNQSSTRMRMAGFGDRTLLASLPRGIFRGGQP